MLVGRRVGVSKGQPRVSTHLLVTQEAAKGVLRVPFGMDLFSRD